ncbi:MAG: monovalent cation/H+ antiporter complex subunit F [Thermoflexales bacterium]
MQEIFYTVVVGALIAHIGLIAVAVWRVWRGDTVMDRLVAVDAISTIVLAIFVLLALIEQDALFMDTALGVALISFISTIALARYIANHKMF